MVKVILDFLMPRLRSSLLDDKDFVGQWNLTTKASVTIGKDGPSFHRDLLYGGIRAAICEPGKQISIMDDNSVVWRITACDENSELSFYLVNDEKKFSISDHSGLAEADSIRVRWFERTANDINFGGVVFRKWKARIDSGRLDDEEFAELVGELELTPVSNYRNLQADISRRSVDIATLVPCEQRYYDRLIGPLGSAIQASNYIESGAAPLIGKLQEWDPINGFLFSLLLCSKGTVAESIRTDKLETDELLRTYEWLAIQGDPISQIGAVEVALMQIERHPELEPSIERMVNGFIADKPEHEGGLFSLLSTMIVLVASELSRRCLLENTHPFYRKQAAIAQASLIIRAINGTQVDVANVVESVMTRGVGLIFFLQGLVDLRVEPRWLPDFVSPYQLRAEFIGRIAGAVEQCKGEIHTQSLRHLLIGNDSRLATVLSAESPYPILPGPLEGEIASKQPTIPDDMLGDVISGLEAEHLEPNSFAGLVNTALLFKLPASQADLAAKALRRVKYSIENADDQNSLFGLIDGLATVAAVTRGTDLAEALRVMMRVMRRRKRLNVDPDYEMRIAMLAAASHEDLDDWALFAGEWITEIAFEVVENEAARLFLLKLRRLVRIEPALARHCAIADAALESIDH